MGYINKVHELIHELTSEIRQIAFNQTDVTLTLEHKESGKKFMIGDVTLNRAYSAEGDVSDSVNIQLVENKVDNK